MRPKRAMSPTLRTICVPVSTSQAVHISTSSAETYAAREMYNRGRRGAVTTSRVKTGPTNNATVPSEKRPWVTCCQRIAL